MKNNKDYPDLPDAESLPCISLILPFDLKMKKENGLFNLLTVAADKIEIDLLRNYPERRVAEVIKKLRKLINCWY